MLYFPAINFNWDSDISNGYMYRTHFHIRNESDYALGLVHGMILTGFISEFKDHNKREPNEEEMVEVRKN